MVDLLKDFFASEKMSDYLDTLPTDNNAPTGHEMQIVNYLFTNPKNKKEVKRTYNISTSLTHTRKTKIKNGFDSQMLKIIEYFQHRIIIR